MNAILALFLALGAGAFEQTFSQANAAYDNGQYREAAVSYEQLVQQSVADPAVFFNLGNCYFRLGNLGYAIANYERSLQLRPSFEAARTNLDQAIAQTEHKLNRPLPPAWEQGLLFWHYDLSYRTTWITSAVCWVLFWSLLALRLVRRWRYLRTTLILLAVAAAAFGTSAWIKAHPVPMAVVTAENVPVRFGTSEDDKVRFELAAGDRVSVGDTRGGWIQVSTGSGERGWADSKAFALVGPPYTDLLMLQADVPTGGAAQ
ncbi:MAG: tetratricopeptide repeat protein [Candidatus Hydrogenedentes bacterium]|nr:tetratricopeptide repeat protein [Candidatus Hydrogenedentota bacterium]